jgi:hypothetical protein
MNKLFVCGMVSALALLFPSCNRYLNISGPGEMEKFMNVEKNIHVLKFHTNDQGLVNFSSKYPGRLFDGEIYGVKQVPLQLFRSDSIVYKIRKLKEMPLFVYNNGRKFEVFKHDHTNFVYTLELINIPMIEVTNIEYKSQGKRELKFIGLVAGVTALSVFIISTITLNVDDAF